MGSRDSYGRDATDQRGSLLVGTLLFVSALTILGFLLYQAAVVENKAVGVTEADARARYAAESGLNRAALDVAWDNTQVLGTLAFDTVLASLPGSDPSTATPFELYGSTCFGNTSCDSDNNPMVPAYVVQAKKVFNPADGTTYADRFQLIATACIPGPAANPCPSGSREAAQVRGLILKGLSTGFGGGLQSIAPPNDPTGCTASKTCLKISAGAIADRYKSGTCNDSPNVVYSNGNIDMSGGTIHGDVTGATNVMADTTDINITGGTIDGQVYSGGTINQAGSQYHSNTPNLPQYTGDVLPDCGVSGYTSLTVGGNVTASPGATWNYNNNVLTILGGTIELTPSTSYCLAGLDVKGGELRITGLTVITVDGIIHTSAGALLNNVTQIPDNLQLVTTWGNAPTETGTDTVSLKAGGIQYLTVYAPTASAQLLGGETYGAVVAKYAEMKSATLHYDQCLANDSNLRYGPHVCGSGPCLAGGAGSYTLLSWQRCKQTSTGWTCT